MAMKQMDLTFKDKVSSSEHCEWFLNLHTGYPSQGTAQEFLERLFMEDDSYPFFQEVVGRAHADGQTSEVSRQTSRVLEVSEGNNGPVSVQDCWDILCCFRGFNFSQKEFEVFVRMLTAHSRVALSQVYFDMTKPPVAICGPRVSYKEPFNLLPVVWVRSKGCDSTVQDSSRPLYASRERVVEKSRNLLVQYADGVNFTTLRSPHSRKTYNVECIEANGSYNKLILSGPSLCEVAQFAASAAPGRELVKVELRK